MTIPSTKRPRIQLDPEVYRQLCRQVLQRDGSRCQACGSRTNLQVHHLELSSNRATIQKQPYEALFSLSCSDPLEASLEHSRH